MRLWLDDLRLAPPGWTHVHTAMEAIKLLAAGGVKEVSLDHDLGMKPPCSHCKAHAEAEFNTCDCDCHTMEPSGYIVAQWIELAAVDGHLTRLEARCHSDNPAGRKRIEAALKSAKRFWTLRETYASRFHKEK